MTTDDGLLMWQRIALERGDPIDIPPRQRREQATSNRQRHDTTKQQLPTVEQPPGAHRIDLPWERPPLNHNHRYSTVWARAAIAAKVRDTLFVLARAAKIPHCDQAVVQLHYAPGHRRRQDPMNWTATTKPAIDGLVAAGVFDDDDTQHVHELTPEIHFPPVPGPRCWLTITPNNEPEKVTDVD